MAMKLLFLVLFHVALAHKRLRIQIEVSTDFADAEAEASGESEQIITDDELTIFGITDDVIRKGVWEIAKSKPSAVIVKDSQSKWSEVYKNNGWEEVTRNFQAKKATVLNIIRRPITLDSKEIYNNKLHVDTVDSGISYNLPDMITTSWGRFNGVTDSRTQVEYKVAFDASETKLYFSLPWGQNTNESRPVAVTRLGGCSLNSFIELNAEEVARVSLTATQVVLDLLIEYEINFEGDVVCYYANSKTFDKFDIETVLEKCNLSKKVTIHESVQVTVYTDVKQSVRRNKN